MDAQYFLSWLTRYPTLITIVGPFLVFLLGFLFSPSWRHRAGFLVLVSLVLTPFSWLFSWWEDGLGLHVLPLFIIAFGQLVALKKLDVRRSWFAIMFASWIGTLAPDLLATWTSYAAQIYVVDHWYGGIGGWGWTDALFQFPFFSLLLLSGAQTATLKKVQTK